MDDFDESVEKLSSSTREKIKEAFDTFSLCVAKASRCDTNFIYDLSNFSHLRDEAIEDVRREWLEYKSIGDEDATTVIKEINDRFFDSLKDIVDALVRCGLE